MKKILMLASSILICQISGLIGSLFTVPAIPAWYDGITKPSFTPPDWLFGPVWITLYLLMGISAWLILRMGLKTPGVKRALLLFGLQLFLNATWSPLFFGMRSPLAGAIVIVPLWFALLATIVLFSRLSRAATFMLIPYIIWLSYAVALNISILILNW